MNKKLLFVAMSLAALTACTNDDFESKNVAQQEVSPIQFEVLNNNDAFTRASMGGTNKNTLIWNANDNDLFTLYHGATLGAVTGYENAIYKANANADGATLTTPSMIKQGGAIMVWPVDTTFRITSDKVLTLTIPATLENVENNIPYVSDLVNIAAKADYATNAYNNAGYSRKYPVYMRPMASQLTVKADYAGTDETIETLYEGKPGVAAGEGIEPIKVTSVSLLTKDAGDKTRFTQTIPLKFTDPSAAINDRWAAATGENAHNAWAKVTDFNVDDITTNGAEVAKLTTKVLTGNESSKFLILPQKTISGGVAEAAVEVNTYYGKVLIAKSSEYTASKYTDDEYNAAWYRIVSAAKDENTEENASTPVTIDGEAKHKVVAKSTALGMQQTINDFSGHTVGSGLTKDEPAGYSLTRYVVVNLEHLDMSNLHITSDKQLRDVARVWKKLGLDPVTVYLDGGKEGDAAGEFTISQKTIEVINTINGSGLGFQVKPCQETGEACTKIVISGSDYKQDVQNIAFITNNGGTKAEVILKNEGTTKPWKWNGTVKVAADGVKQIINKGTMQNAADATLKTAENNGTQNNVLLINDGTWNITAGTLFVQFSVTNNGKVEISDGAEYRQDGTGHIFTNEASAKPSRFGGDDSKIGLVNNFGVFATVNTGKIYNYGLIEHKLQSSKTYISKNQTETVDFKKPFGDGNKMGRINLLWSNKDEDNVSIEATLDKGFVSVTVDGEVTGTLNADAVGPRVNYVIVKSGVTSIANMPTGGQIKYLEIDDKNKKEIEWNVTTAQSFEGLMVLSKVNIKLNTTINATVTYLGADMYVGGTFNKAATVWDGYYGETSGNVATKYVTY